MAPTLLRRFEGEATEKLGLFLEGAQDSLCVIQHSWVSTGGISCLRRLRADSVVKWHHRRIHRHNLVEGFVRYPEGEKEKGKEKTGWLGSADWCQIGAPGSNGQA